MEGTGLFTWNDLLSSPKTQHQVEGGFFLDVVVRQGAAIFQLLASKDQPLLVRGDAFLVLNLRLYILNGVRWLYFECDGLASQGFDKDLHPAPQPEDQVQGGFLLDVIIREGPSVLKLLTSKDQPLLIRWDTFFVLNLSLDILNRVGRLNLESDGFTGEGFHEDLHAAPKAEDQVKRGLLLNVVIRKSSTILELLPSKDQSLLIGRNPFLVLNLGLNILNGVGRLHL